MLRTEEEQEIHVEQMKLNKESYLETKALRAKLLYTCPCCKCDITQGSKSGHIKSLKHQQALLKQTEYEET